MDVAREYGKLETLKDCDPLLREEVLKSPYKFAPLLEKLHLVYSEGDSTKVDYGLATPIGSRFGVVLSPRDAQGSTLDYQIIKTVADKEFGDYRLVLGKKLVTPDRGERLVRFLDEDNFQYLMLGVVRGNDPVRTDPRYKITPNTVGWFLGAMEHLDSSLLEHGRPGLLLK